MKKTKKHFIAFIMINVLFCGMFSININAADTVWAGEVNLNCNLINYPFAGVYIFDNLTIEEDTTVNSIEISQLVIIVKGKLTIKNNAVIRVRNGFYKDAPIADVSKLTPNQLNSLSVFDGEGYSIYPQIYGKGGDGGNGGAGAPGVIQRYIINGVPINLGGNGGHGGGGGAGGYGGGSIGSGGVGGIAYLSGHIGDYGSNGDSNGNNGGTGGKNSYSPAFGGNALKLGLNGLSGILRGSGGNGGGGNGGDGASGRGGIAGFQNNVSINVGICSGGGGGGGGGYGGGVLVITASEINIHPSAKLIVSGQKGGIGGIGGGFTFNVNRGSKGENGHDGQGGLLIVNSIKSNLKASNYNADLLNSPKLNGHGKLSGNPACILYNLNSVPKGNLQRDLNSDGLVDILDLIILQNYLAGKIGLTPDQIKSAEIDSVPGISPSDAEALLKYILN